MDATLLKTLLAFLPASMLFAGSVILVSKGKTLPAVLQLVGAACLLVVVFTHLCEALSLFPSMQWGMEHSVGHYVDLSAAVLGLTLLPAGYLLHAHR